MLFLNQNKLYSESVFGKELEFIFKKLSSELVKENQQLTKELETEEKKLTADRRELSTEEFRVLAEKFNLKVEKVRQEQKEKSDLLKKRLEDERKYFFKVVYPLLLNFVESKDALGILDSSLFIVANKNLDITDQLIDIINNEINVTPSINR
jgi:Skp family chaperone for outer membrane proteins